MSEPARVVVVELPSGEAISEIGVDPAIEHEIAWVGSPPRLLVLSRHPTHTTVHLLEPHGPETIAEIQLASAVGLFGSVGAHALVIGAHGAAVLTAGEAHLTPYQFPARSRPTVAGAAANQFVVALPGTIEEWDPAARVPKRRLRLPRPTTITALGGSERVVWMVTQQEPARIDVLPLINRGQPKTHDLPEALAMVAGHPQISGHPKSDLLACVGASGRAYAIDLDGRIRLRSLAFPELDHVEAIALVVGRSTGVVAAQQGRPLSFMPLDARDAQVSAASMVVPTRFDEPAPQPTEDPPRSSSSSLVENLMDAAMSIASKVGVTAPPTPAAAPPPPPAPPAPAVPEPAAATKTAKNLAARFAAVRERREMSLVSSVPVSTPAPVDAPRAAVTSVAVALDIQPRGSWRDDCVAWARDVLAMRGDGTPMPPPPAVPIDDIAARFELSLAIAPALALLYGAHLAGHDGVAPVDVARVLDRRWDEALGRGELASSGVARYERSRVRIATAVQRVLDELPPLAGTLVGVPGTVALLGACVLVERGDALDIAARHALRAGGAILVGHDASARDVCFEARARGAAAMLPASKFDGDPSAAVIYVADDDADADRLGLPRL